MKTTFRLSLLLAVLATLLIVFAVNAQTGDGYDLTWSTLDGGGGTSTGSVYSLSGTFGQFDAGALTGSAGGKSYALTGGFWVDFQPYRLFLPLVLKS